MLHVDRSTTRAGRALDRQGLVALLACVGLLLGIGGASVWQAQRNDLALRAAQQTRRQRDRAANLMMSARDAETSQRGFLLTLNQEYLAPFRKAELGMPALLAAVEADHPDDPRTTVLHQVAQAKFAELAQTVRLAEAGDLQNALRIIRTNAGSIDMDVMRRIVAGYEADLDSRLATEVARIVAGGRLMMAIDLAGLLMIFALSGLIAVGLRRTMGRLRTAQAQTTAAYDALEHVNEGLDETVRRRTAELSNANEGDPALRLHRLARPARASGEHHGLHQRAGTGGGHALATLCRVRRRAVGRAGGRRRGDPRGLAVHQVVHEQDGPADQRHPAPVAGGQADAGAGAARTWPRCCTACWTACSTRSPAASRASRSGRCRT